MAADMTRKAPQDWVGQSTPRLEDRALLCGQARFIDDLEPVARLHHAAILRSPHGHAEIEAIDTSRAEELPGVAGVLTGADVAALSKPLGNMICNQIRFFPCAVTRARYFGEPIAVVVAQDRYVAEDALDLIEVKYRPLPAVVDAEVAMGAEAPVIHEEVGSNALQHRTFRYGEPDAAFDQAHRTVRVKVNYPRVNSTPVETYGAIAEFDAGAERYTIWSNFQGPFALHPLMCGALGVGSQKLRLIGAPASGGSFGIKHGLYPYMVLLALASRKFGVPVKWTEDRVEHLAGSSASSGRTTAIEGAFDSEGILTGLRFHQIENVGAYVRVPEPAALYRMHATLNGPYRVRNIAVDNHVVVTNQVPSGLNRGFGGPQFFYPLERLMDVAAGELDLDPAELRRRNLVPANAFPYECPAGSILDSGDYQKALDLALRTIDYDALKADHARRRKEGRLCGIGIAVAVETSGSNMAYVGLALTPEQRAESLPKSGASASARVSMDAAGSVIVHVDSVPNGQGHRTVVAQVVADELGMQVDDIEVVTELDTFNCPWSITSGNYANRFSTTVVSSAALAARQAAHKVRLVAGREFGVAPERVELSGGYASAPGARNAPIPIRRLAAQLHWHTSDMPDGVNGPIMESATFAPKIMEVADNQDRLRSSLTYSFQCDIAAVEIDPGTGQVHVEKYVTVHDVGNMLNPKLVDGQVLGGFAHGFGAGMLERVAYGADGTLLSSTFQDYMCPTAHDLPQLTIAHTTTPSPNTEHGSKGLGDGSSMIAPVTLANAIAQAAGLRQLVPPFTPPRVWTLLQGDDPDAEEVDAPAQDRHEPSFGGHPLSGEGTVELDAPRSRVWHALFDVQGLKGIIPGCKELRQTGQYTYEAVVDIRVAGIGGRYSAQIHLSDLREPDHLRIGGSAEGSLGTGRGEATVRLAELADGGTRLHYSYRAGVSGKVAGFGHRMLDSVTRVLIGSFFSGLAVHLGSPAPRKGVFGRLYQRIMLLWRIWRQ